ncbi:MAG: metal-dependent transcriptional regulator [Caldilineaceae bacterium SB0668_bin_21]|nr:metal-dependent transcriptional regulator [Caldilineaceae bacterium SB0668_bin_21]MYC21016.1 metal-dependent transcriptional regulator [Caldilineaceae bacterium SB0662_bin_25]
MRTFCNIITDGMLDYLVAIYELGETNDRISTSVLAQKMEVTPAAASSMTKRLTETGHVVRTAQAGIQLTDQGRLAALQLLRRHRLLEVFLIEVMGFTWDQVKAEAMRLEHAISPEFEKRMEILCNFPTHCPHGDPVPSEDGHVQSENLVSLAELGPGQTGELRRVANHNAPMLRYLTQMNLEPGHRVKVLNVEPFDGPSIVQIENGSTQTEPGGLVKIIGRSLAKCLYVRLTEQPAA